MNQQPTEIKRAPLDDGYGNIIIEGGKPVQTREYFFKNMKGEVIVIQEHSRGHSKATSSCGADPYFNVRPDSNIRTGSIEGAHGHYNFP